MSGNTDHRCAADREIEANSVPTGTIWEFRPLWSPKIVLWSPENRCWVTGSRASIPVNSTRSATTRNLDKII